ncbi:nuclear transport factor 2 family protein [Jannaschia sp. KMU-145]|uniref:nuclear transport factor 2 family protein n=1 Tax=Jannaschia halovivens TaxID=3388667 RepID=UPI00396B2D0F
MSDLRALTDRAAIRDVLADYCRALDRMDLAALAALFTRDCEVAFGPDPRLTARGRDDLERSMARMWRWRRTAHHLGQVRIWFDGPDHARAESYVLAWHETSDGRPAVLHGVYRDRLRRTDEGWRLSHRAMEMNAAEGAFHVPIPPVERALPPKGWCAPEGLDG